SRIAAIRSEKRCTPFLNATRGDHIRLSGGAELLFKEMDFLFHGLRRRWSNCFLGRPWRRIDSAFLRFDANLFAFSFRSRWPLPFLWTRPLIPSRRCWSLVFAIFEGLNCGGIRRWSCLNRCRSCSLVSRRARRFRLERFHRQADSLHRGIYPNDF